MNTMTINTNTAPFRGGEGLDNILLNPNQDDTFTHVEVDRNHVRLEFKNPWDETYQHFAALFVARGHEEYDKVYERSPDIVRKFSSSIKDVRNSIHCGAGATVYVPLSLSLSCDVRRDSVFVRT